MPGSADKRDSVAPACGCPRLLLGRRRLDRLPAGWRQWASWAGTYSMAAAGITLNWRQIRRRISTSPGSAWTYTTAISPPSAINRPDQGPALPTWEYAQDLLLRGVGLGADRRA